MMPLSTPRFSPTKRQLTVSVMGSVAATSVPAGTSMAQASSPIPGPRRTSGGNVSGNIANSGGGGIQNPGAATLTNVILEDNRSSK